MPRRDPRRAADADARLAGRGHDRELTTGEPDAWKLARPVRRGADGKGRSRLSVTADVNGLTNPGTSRTSPAAYPALLDASFCTCVTRFENPRGGHVFDLGPALPLWPRL